MVRLKSRRRSKRPGLTHLLPLAAASLLMFAPQASADQVICGPGSGPGQCQSPAGVAVDREAGLLYVADAGNQEVDVFDADDGSFLDSFAAGGTPRGVAVDNDLASPAHGDVYVLLANSVRRFHPDGEFVLAIGDGQFVSDKGSDFDLGPGGLVYVADTLGDHNRRVQIFDHEGNEVEECASLEPAGSFGQFFSGGIAVDSSGDFFVPGEGGLPLRKYDAICALITAPPFDGFHQSFNVQALVVSATDDLFISDSGPSATPEIYRYDAAGTLLRVLYGNGTLQGRPIALAPYSSPFGDLFAAEPSGTGLGRVVQIAFEPPGPVVHPDPRLSAANPIGNTKATLSARINPEGKATTYHFEYVDDASYDSEGGFASPKKKSTAETALSSAATPTFAPELFRLATASVDIGCPKPANPPQTSCLAPETKYHFRAVASNPDGAERFGPEAEFETKPPFEILALWASEVGSYAARLHAQVNPLNVSTGGRFEYVEEAIFQASGFAQATQFPAAVDFGSAETPQTRAVQVHQLQPDTAYRYRIVVESVFGKEEERQGSFRTFAQPGVIPPCANDAFRTGPAARLPDCRAYEMVSPVDKEGGDLPVLFNSLQKSAATVPAEGLGLTYSSRRAFSEPISAPLIPQYLARRHPVGHPEAGWSSEAISPPREGPMFNVLGALSNIQYRAFSEDLTQSWVRTDSEPPLTADAIPAYTNVYRRESETGSYEALCPKKPPKQSSIEYTPHLTALSGDGEVAVLSANDRLTPNASAGDRQIYACKKGDPEPVLLSILPGGAANPDSSSVGTHVQNSATRDDSIHNAVSTDGSRVYWTDLDQEGDEPGQIYLRENPFAAGAECAGASAPCTVAVSQAVGGPGSSEEAIYWTASPDGGRAIFSFRFGPLEGNLYEFDATAETEPTRLIAEEVSGVAGWSEDARRIYFVSTKELVPGAVAGVPNLYLHDAEEGSFALVATLPAGAAVLGSCQIHTYAATGRCAMATPDGHALAFMSSDPLTGYDNTDATSPVPCGQPGGRCDSEVFLYDARAEGGAGELRCVSCNPSGSRPVGKNLGNEIHPAWVAARLPQAENSFHVPRALPSDGRRLFFESFDPLVVRDTNGAKDVYEWQAPGKGDCSPEREEFVASAGGCIYLISSGQDRHDSSFVDASADGSDVFFRTIESLLPHDPALTDIYDARAGGGFPISSPPDPPCEGEACQSPPAPPQAPSPASSAFEGPGNPAAKPRRRACPKGKRRAVRKGKPRCLAKKRKGAQRQGRRAGR